MPDRCCTNRSGAEGQTHKNDNARARGTEWTSVLPRRRARPESVRASFVCRSGHASRARRAFGLGSLRVCYGLGLCFWCASSKLACVTGSV